MSKKRMLKKTADESDKTPFRDLFLWLRESKIQASSIIYSDPFNSKQTFSHLYHHIYNLILIINQI